MKLLTSQSIVVACANYCTASGIPECGGYALAVSEFTTYGTFAFCRGDKCINRIGVEFIG